MSMLEKLYWYKEFTLCKLQSNTGDICLKTSEHDNQKCGEPLNKNKQMWLSLNLKSI